jgi:ABC-type branched-subunit amino acid transport system substrate-binding protein
MRRLSIALAAILILAAGTHAAPEEKPGKTAWPGFEIDEDMNAILEIIKSAGAYQVPDLGIKKDHNYAQTPVDIEPFGPVRPFKEHFLEQIEYTGPGRAIPEPENLETVKIGFIGPIMPTVSVATGGASHDVELGIQMLRGTRLAIEEANKRGGYLERGIPFELVVTNDNGAAGIWRGGSRSSWWSPTTTVSGAHPETRS